MGAAVIGPGSYIATKVAQIANIKMANISSHLGMTRKNWWMVLVVGTSTKLVPAVKEGSFGGARLGSMVRNVVQFFRSSERCKMKLWKGWKDESGSHRR